MNKNCSSDYGDNPYALNIQCAAIHNNNYRTSIWTGKHLQATLMSIPVSGDIGLECHPDTDQFFHVEQGMGLVKMGDIKENLNFLQKVFNGYAIFIPAGTWHNILNIGNIPLKLYSIYSPPRHPFCTIQRAKKDAMYLINII